MELTNVTDSTNIVEVECELSCTTALKSKILRGEFSIVTKRGRSKVWNIFGAVKNEFGVIIENIVACRTCYNVHKYNPKTTSNLVRHKSYVSTQSNESKTAVDVDSKTKASTTKILTQWSVENCRPFQIVNDRGLHHLIEHCIQIGARFGGNICIKSLLQHPTTISNNIAKLYQTYHQILKTEVEPIKNIGYGLTSDLWTDNYLRKTYVAVTIHYPKEGQLFRKLFGLISMEGEKCTNDRVLFRVSTLLSDFGLELDDKAVIVTDRGSNMIAAFRSYNHIFCVAHLLHNALQKAMQELEPVDALCRSCTKLVKYFKANGVNSVLQTTLKSYTPTRWNSVFNMFLSIEKNWSQVIHHLQERNELNRINDIHFSHIREVITVLEPFEEAFKKLEGDKMPTLKCQHLKKKCSSSSTDYELIKQLKEKLLKYLESTVDEHLKIVHKIALFLFPPTNKLFQYDIEEKQSIKKECMQMMEFYKENVSNGLSQSTSLSTADEAFTDFIDRTEINAQSTEHEISSYQNINVRFEPEFDVLKWWDLHKNEYPLLYKFSCKIFSIPSTSAPSERVFSQARCLIFEKRSNIASNDTTISQIMFLHENIDKDELISIPNDVL